jgi:uncharacterized protein (TIGR02246 family)
MKRFALALLLMTALASTAHAADAKGAAQVEDAWRTAMLANDVDAIVKLYASDATLWLGGSPRFDGADAIRATYTAWLGANTIKDVTFANRKSQTAGDISVGWGEYTVTVVPKAGGDAVTHRGRFTDVAAKRNGKWLYIVDHASDEPVAAVH